MVLFSVLRPRHWLKNLLVFVVPVAASVLDWGTLFDSALAFVALSFAASSTYAINDVLDRGSDRKHPAKRRRAVASGRVTARAALVLAGLSLASSFLVALFVSVSLLGLVLIYFGMTVSYSLWLKSFPAVDIVLLATFFVLRIFAGGLATGLPVSDWLLATSFFAFLSLASAKRAVELLMMGSSAPGPISGRGYHSGDKEIVTVVGVAAGLGAAILLGLYVEDTTDNGGSVLGLLLWVIPGLWVYWVMRLWIIVNRGQLDYDPIDFVMKDRVTYALGVVVSVVFFVA